MGITTILGSALKNLPWRAIATVALERAPELYQKTKERFQEKEAAFEESALGKELQERISHLQSLLIEQKGLNRELAAKCAFLEKRTATLESSLFSFKVVSGVLFISAMIMLALLIQ
jgi:hypothetical protein